VRGSKTKERDERLGLDARQLFDIGHVAGLAGSGGDDAGTMQNWRGSEDGCGRRLASLHPHHPV
jgi:hypothetical protein